MHRLVKFIFGKRGKAAEKSKLKVKSGGAILATSIVVLIIAAASFTTGLGTAGWDFTKLDTATYTAASFTEFNDTINSINITGDTSGIIIKKATDGNFKVDYYEIEKRTVTVTFDDSTGALSVTEKHERGFQFFAVDLWSWINYGNKNSIYIYLPDTITEDSSVELSTGSIYVEDIQFEGELTLKATTGSITVKDVIAKDKLNLKTTTGSITVKDAIVEDKLTMEATTGSIYGDKVNAKKVYAKATTGSVYLERLTSDNIELNTTTGSINAKMTLLKSDFTITTKVTTGYKNTHSGGAGPKILKATATTGSIHLKFGESHH